MSMPPWFVSNEHLYAKELEALKELGFDFEVDELAFNSGVLRIHLLIDNSKIQFQLPGTGKSINLIAVFPDVYPYFRPEVYAYDLDLPRHQNLVGKNLCLLPRATESWEPELTLADYLKLQLPKVIIKGSITDPDVLAGDLEEQAEPASEYYPVLADKPVFVDSSVFKDLHTVTEITRLGTGIIGIPSEAEFPSPLAIVEILDVKGRSVSKLPNLFQQRYQARGNCSLYQLPERPPFGVAEEDSKWIRDLLNDAGQKLDKQKSGVKLKRDTTLELVIGVCFPEEVSPGLNGLGWLFIVSGTIKHIIPKGKGSNHYLRPISYFAKATKISDEDFKIRIPAVIPLQNKSIAIIGLGALGSSSAIELAKNCVGHLKLLDFDIVEPSTTVRWALGLSQAGKLKTDSLKQYIEENYPNTKVDTIRYRIGMPSIDGKENIVAAKFKFSQDVVDALFENTSLIFDASAELGVSHYLSQQAKMRGIPFVSIYATPGAVGGLVMRVVPGKVSGCWMCLQHAKNDGLIDIPPSDVNGNIQAPGCGDLTFTGTSFDLQNISIAGVRLAVATLCHEEIAGYQNVQSDVGILRLVDADNLPIFPSWKEYKLDRHPNCPYCG